MNKTTTAKNLGENRNTFFARLTAALERDTIESPEEPAPQVDEYLIRLSKPDHDIVDQFAARCAETGMTVHRCDVAGAAAKVLGLLHAAGAKRIILGAGVLENQIALREMFTAAGIDIVEWKHTPNMDAQFEVDAGITDVHSAIAETGTIVCNSDADHGRGLSLIPPVHLALVRHSDIVPDMIDYWADLKNLSPTQLPSSQAMITGPSKTADIEGELIQGVHGPGTVHIILMASI